MRHSVLSPRSVTSFLVAALSAVGCGGDTRRVGSGEAVALGDAAHRRPRVVADFAPGTPPEYIEQMTQRLEALYAENTGGPDDYAFQAGNRWPGAAGDPIALSWSIVPDGTPWSNGFNLVASNMLATLDTQFAGAGGRAAWVQRFVLGFQRWNDLTGVDFTRIDLGNDSDDGQPWNTEGAPGQRGDIRIGMVPLDGPLGLLAFAVLPGTGSSSPGDDGDIVLDSQENWFQATWNPQQGFNRTITHEAGHALGLLHVCPVDATKLMEPVAFSGLFTYGPQHDDVRGAQSLYGDFYEPNDSTDSPYYLGLPSQGNNLNIGDIVDPYGVPPGDYGPGQISSGLLSVHPGDTDVFAIRFPGSTHVQVVLRRIGAIYPEAPMTCGSSGFDCCTNTWTISYNVADLLVELVDRNGIVLTSAQTNGGSTAILYYTLQLVNVPTFVRVTPLTPSFPGVQSYDLEFTTHAGVPCQSYPCDDGNPVNGIEVCQGDGSCIVEYPGGDCNFNYLDDWWEIFNGSVIDCDGNGVPDECETDCNGNGVLDSCDIASGFSADCDGNGVPDECQLDCNANGIPDACDILTGTSLDANSNGVPDECESTLFVPGQYPSLRAAVEAASNGDTIFVAPGTYAGADNRNIDIVDRTLQIVAEGCPDDTIIDLEGLGRAFFVGSAAQANATRIEGFTIRNGDADLAPNWSAEGGAIYCWGADLRLEKCVLRDNRASGAGGALLIRNDAGDGFANVQVVSCLFHDNEASVGGAAYVRHEVHPNFINCTFSLNAATLAGGAVASEGSGDGAALVSSIVWRNGPLADQLAPGGTNFTVWYTDLPPQEFADFPGPGNISQDPLFVDTALRNFHLKPASPCRNAGHPLYTPPPGSQDIDCQPRLQEGRVEMGADERRNLVLPADPEPTG